MRVKTDSEAIVALTKREYPFVKTASEKLKQSQKTLSVLSLETPLEAWDRYVTQCLDELLRDLEKL
jgi:hypothetical protein